MCRRPRTMACPDCREAPGYHWTSNPCPTCDGSGRVLATFQPEPDDLRPFLPEDNEL